MKNKVTTYLLYAFGEILLVVAGILIAVSIDDWNQSKLNQKAVEKYIGSLKRELKENLDVIENDLKYDHKLLDSLYVIKEIMTKETSNLDTLVWLARYHFDFNYDPDTHLNNITFRTLESTGDIALLEPILRDSLYQYQAQLSKLTNLIEFNIDFYQTLDESYHSVYPASGSEIFLKGKAADQLWDRIDMDDFLLRFNAIVSNKMIVDEHKTKWRNQLKKETTSFINFLERTYP